MSNLIRTQNEFVADRSRSKTPSHEVNRQFRKFHTLQRTIGNQAVQRMIRSNGRGFENKSVHEAAARGTQGSGKSLPFLNQIQRAFGRHDVSHARAHEGERATSAAKSMGASAYTTGHDVAFASVPDLHTAAHEAAHIVQQRAGVKLAGNVGQTGDVYEQHADAVADRVVRGQSSEGLLDKFAQQTTPGSSQAAVQMSKQPTPFGEFEDVYYNTVTNSKDEEIGCEMYLRFTPGDTVDATKIGLTQIVKPMKEGTFDAVDETKKKQAVTTGAGKDFYLDQLAAKQNPIYGAKPGAAADKDKLEGWDVGPKVTEMTAKEKEDYQKSSGQKGVKYTAASMGQWGYRKKSGADWIKQPAELDDVPTRPGSIGKKNSGQLFETTALAVEGAQKNTYYGSVQWGWERDDAGTFKLVDFKIVSQGTPSAAFMAAAEKWNTSKTSGGEETIDLPTFEIFKPNKEMEVLSGTDKIKLVVTNRVHVISKGAKATDPWKVKIVDGPNTGKEVTVDGAALTKE